jgi:hypothetical protein
MTEEATPTPDEGLAGATRRLAAAVDSLETRLARQLGDEGSADESATEPAPKPEPADEADDDVDSRAVAARILGEDDCGEAGELAERILGY